MVARSFFGLPSKTDLMWVCGGKGSINAIKQKGSIVWGLRIFDYDDSDSIGDITLSDNTTNYGEKYIYIYGSTSNIVSGDWYFSVDGERNYVNYNNGNPILKDVSKSYSNSKPYSTYLSSTSLSIKSSSSVTNRIWLLIERDKLKIPFSLA